MEAINTNDNNKVCRIIRFNKLCLFRSVSISKDIKQLLLKVNRTAEPCATTRSKIQAIFIDHLIRLQNFSGSLSCFRPINSLDLIKTSRIQHYSTVTLTFHLTVDKIEVSRIFCNFSRIITYFFARMHSTLFLYHFFRNQYNCKIEGFFDCDISSLKQIYTRHKISSQLADKYLHSKTPPIFVSVRKATSDCVIPA